MKILIDAMGGDLAPGCAVEGALLAAQAYPDCEIVLVGDEGQVKLLLEGKATYDTQIRTGDLNGDAAISSADARLILKALLNEAFSLTQVQQYAADSDNDGSLSTADARAVLKSTF